MGSRDAGFLIACAFAGGLLVGAALHATFAPARVVQTSAACPPAATAAAPHVRAAPFTERAGVRPTLEDVRVAHGIQGRLSCVAK